MQIPFFCKATKCTVQHSNANILITRTFVLVPSKCPLNTTYENMYNSYRRRKSRHKSTANTYKFLRIWHQNRFKLIPKSILRVKI